MFSFWRRSQPARLTPAIAKALAGEGLPPGLDPATLEMVQQRGSYAGRTVNRFRVFDPRAVAGGTAPVRTYADLDGHPELVIGAGHVEQHGAVVLIKRSTYVPSPSLERLRANRADHVDDEQFVREYIETPAPVARDA
jgi:hypothetical protein